MAHVFISYSKKHRELTSALATAIETRSGAGSVWWDHALESWGDYEIQIRNALDGARAGARPADRIRRGQRPAVVLDYAEGRQQDIKKIVEQINGRQDGDARPVRLVLLARSAGEWWTALHDETPDVQRLFRRDPLNADVRALAALPEGGPRRELFHDSVKTFGPTLAAQGYAISQSPPSSDVLARIETEASPLAVQMQALLWLVSAGSDDGAATIEVLLQRVLSLERAHWGKLLGTLDDAQYATWHAAPPR